MGIYIIFGGCIVLAVVWMLMSLPVRRTAEPGVVLAFDIIATVLVVALFGAGTYAYVGQQNRKTQEVAGQEQLQESGVEGETVVPVNGDTQGSGTGNSTETSPAIQNETTPGGGTQANDPTVQPSQPQVTTAPDTIAPANQESQPLASEGQNATIPPQPSEPGQAVTPDPSEAPQTGQGDSAQTSPQPSTAQVQTPPSQAPTASEPPATTAPSAPAATTAPAP